MIESVYFLVDSHEPSGSPKIHYMLRTVISNCGIELLSDSFNIYLQLSSTKKTSLQSKPAWFIFFCDIFLQVTNMLMLIVTPLKNF